MDIDRALQSMREWVQEVTDNPFRHDVSEIDAAEQFAALDQWLSTGGFRPDAWYR